MGKTPSELWKAKIVNYKKKCQNILQLSKSIRYVGIINVYGRTLTGIIRENEKPLLKSEQVKNEFFIISTLMTLRKDMIETLGKLEHAIMQHQKVYIIIFQKNSITYYISIDKTEKNIDKIISDVKKII